MDYKTGYVNAAQVLGVGNPDTDRPILQSAIDRINEQLAQCFNISKNLAAGLNRLTGPVSEEVAKAKEATSPSVLSGQLEQIIGGLDMLQSQLCRSMERLNRAV